MTKSSDRRSSSFCLLQPVIYDFLNLSRPYLVRLLVQGEIPYRRIGARRRVFFQDLMEYLQQSRQQHAAALDELTDQAPTLDTGY